MKKTLFTLYLLLMGGLVSKTIAQEISIVGGMNISNMIDKSNNTNYAKEDNYKSRIGGHIGALIGFNLADNISLQTGLLLSTKGFKAKDEDRYEKEVYKTNLAYLEVPVLASYNYEIKNDIKVFAGLGPVLGVAIGGKFKNNYVDKDDHSENEKESEKIKFGSSEDDNFKRIDLGLMIQAGVQYDKYKFGLFYNAGLLNLSNWKGNGNKEKNKVFGISLAYVIDLNK